MFIDSHTHLTLITKNRNEIKDILKKCYQNNIGLLFNISVDFDSNFITKQLSVEYDGLYLAVGIHPSEADKIIGMN